MSNCQVQVSRPWKRASFRVPEKDLEVDPGFKKFWARWLDLGLFKRALVSKAILRNHSAFEGVCFFFSCQRPAYPHVVWLDGRAQKGQCFLHLTSPIAKDAASESPAATAAKSFKSNDTFLHLNRGMAIVALRFGSLLSLCSPAVLSGAIVAFSHQRLLGEALLTPGVARCSPSHTKDC